jgi:FMN-dependent NADH-azoreductase
MTALNKILRIDSSARYEGSVSRQLSQKVIDRLSEKGAIQVTNRDVSQSMPFVSSDWVNANIIPLANRTTEQLATLSFSDQLVSELENADTIIIGLPIYNFGVPASLKAWVDMVARAGVTFRYTETGPIGLLKDKRAIILVASGGTPMGSDIDHATPYLRQALKFIGITNITFIAADGLGQQAEMKIKQAQEQISRL